MKRSEMMKALSILRQLFEKGVHTYEMSLQEKISATIRNSFLKEKFNNMHAKSDFC